MGSTFFAGNTRPVFGFPGGVHPPEHKSDSNTQPIRTAAIPAQLVVPLAQHLGAPAEPVVAVGDAVRTGQLIARAKGALSANVHAPASGRILAIEARAVQHPSGLELPCIVIASDGRDEWVARDPLPDWRGADADALRARIRDAGIAGMGGAGFPAAVKLAPRQRITQLLLNAVECEPYITADDLLMRERASQVIEGLLILAHILKPDEILVGIEDNKPQAIATMRQAASGTPVQVVVVPTKYPSGGEKQLIQNLTGKEVPSGGLPADVGVVCHNTGTAHAVYRAVVLGEPLVARIVTLTGDALARRGNVEARIGTAVIDLLREAGLDERRLHRVVMGGPMMGFTLYRLDVPVVKTTNCLIAASTQELPDPAPEQPCIRCGACAEACPASLLPQQLYWFSRSGELDKARAHHVMDCIECGACAYVCPSSIPLVQYYRHTKGEIRLKQAEERKAEHAKQRFEARKARLEREHAEREARRQARANAAKARSEQPAAAPAAAPAAIDEALLARLKSASLAASGEYKAAVKALKDAEAAGSTDLAHLQRHVDELKARADAAKAAVRDAQQGAGGEAAPVAPPAPAIDLEKLRHAMGEASSAYKAAVRAANEAEAAGAENAGALRQEAERLKQQADALKAQVRDAKAATGDTSPAGSDTGPAMPAAPTVPDMEQLKLLKTAAASARKQAREAAAALDTAERAGSDNLAAMRERVAQLQQKADAAQQALDAVVASLKPARSE